MFLGLCGYLRRHIRRYALLAKPLTKLTEKHRVFSWGAEQQAAFETLKAALVSAPVLAFPVFDFAAPPFLLDTDASGSGIGATLMQGDHVIAYASRALTKSERQYSVTKRELLATVWAVQHFRSFLVGRRFVLRTDHAALQWLFEMQDAEGQMARWQFLLREFDFEVVHRKGTQHGNADALSRYPHPLQTDEVRYRWVCVPVEEDPTPESQMAPDGSHEVAAVSDIACPTVEEGDTRETGVTLPSATVKSVDTEVPLEDRVCTEQPPPESVDLAAAKLPADAASDSVPHCTAAVVTGPAEVGVLTLTMAEFHREQQRDDGIREIMTWKKRRVRPKQNHLHSSGAAQLLREWSRLVVQGDDKPVLYRRVQSERDAPMCLQIVMPQHLRRKLLEQSHAGFGGGHQGTAKLESMVRRQFYWPGLQADVKAFCRRCVDCSLRKDPPRAPQASLGSLQAAGFMDRLDIDICSERSTRQ